jgi:methionyl-tRNA formyltransferase
MTGPAARIIFMGTPEFAVPSLARLLEAGHEIVTVVTGPDKPRGRGQKLTPTPVKELALAHHLPLLQPESVKDPAFADAVRAVAPDIAVVVAFRILPRAVFAVPKLGTFNLHSSLLPKYRGAAPINWAVINGDTETGVTTFFLDDRVDTGAMLLQERIAIDPEEDAGSVHDRLAVLGADVVARTVGHILKGDLVPQQQDAGAATPAPKIFKEHCHIDWTKPARVVHDRIRGMSPHPGAFALHDGHVLKIFRSTVQEGRVRGIPGTVLVHDGRLFVMAADHPLELIDLQQEGRRRMTSADFLRGYTFPPSTLLV